VVAASAATAGAASRQQLLVTEINYRLKAPALRSLHAGFVTVTVRNEASGEHGLLILRLRRPLTHKQIVAALGRNDLKSFDAQGGVAVVPPRSSWEGTIKLVPGRYVIVDGGVNGGKTNAERGMLRRSPSRPAGPRRRRRAPSARS
jgi:hypothetical protein